MSHYLMSALTSVELAIAHYKMDDLRIEVEHDEMVRAARKSRFSWFNRQPREANKPEPEAIAAREWIDAGRSACLRSI